MWKRGISEGTKRKIKKEEEKTERGGELKKEKRNRERKSTQRREEVERNK